MRPLKDRSTILQILFAAFVVMEFVMAAGELYIAALLRGEAAQLEDAEIGVGIVALLYLVNYLGLAVMFLIWFRSMYKSIEEAGVPQLQYSPGWAVGGFFVPFLNLVRPYQVMREIWRGLKHLLEPETYLSIDYVPSPTLMKVWWGLYLFWSVLARSSARLETGAETASELILASEAGAIESLVGAAAGTAALLWVRAISELYEEVRVRRELAGVAADPAA